MCTNRRIRHMYVYLYIKGCILNYTSASHAPSKTCNNVTNFLAGIYFKNGIRNACSTADTIDCLLVFCVVSEWSPCGLVQLVTQLDDLCYLYLGFCDDHISSSQQQRNIVQQCTTPSPTSQIPKTPVFSLE